jgi:dTDP-4-dehydrorhamnose 3,5-epimerase-like enzyme
MIDGVQVRQLKEIRDDRGKLMEMFRASETGVRPQQVYLTTALEGVVKDKDGFHMHKKQVDFFCCLVGKIKLVLVDVRPRSKTKGEINELEIGEDNLCLVKIPNNVLHAFKSLKGESYIVNCINREYHRKDPDEFRIKNIYYDWDRMCPIKTTSATA